MIITSWAHPIFIQCQIRSGVGLHAWYAVFHVSERALLRDRKTWNKLSGVSKYVVISVNQSLVLHRLLVFSVDDKKLYSQVKYNPQAAGRIINELDSIFAGYFSSRGASRSSCIKMAPTSLFFITLLSRRPSQLRPPWFLRKPLIRTPRQALRVQLVSDSLRII